jgi:hypothetical protein
MGRRIGGVALAFAAAIGACGLPLSEPLPPEEVEAYQSCFSEDDCVAIENGCCCEMVSIQREQQTAFRSRFSCDEACECPAKRLVATCRQGTCTLIILAGDPP